MTSEIDKLKHFHVENWRDTNLADDLNDGEEFLYTIIRYKDNKEVALLCKYVKKKHIGNCLNCVFNKYFSTDRYSFNTKEWTKNKNPICWYGGLFEHKNNVLTGRYFNTCLLYEHYIDKEWMPKPTKIIDCVEVEISPDNWIMSVDADNIDLLILSCNYSIQWKECSCLKGIRLEDVTVELEEEAYKEMRNNK